MALPGELNYEKQMEEHFGTLTTIKKITKNIFKAYPVRVRTQEPVTYYEIGARNIDENGDVVILGEDTIKESANTAAYEAQVLREGDIIIPFRNKKLHAGLFKGSDLPMVPNPSLMVIRSESLLIGKYLLLCLQQPFIISYLEYLAQDTGKLEIEDVVKLAIPTISIDLKKRMDKLEKITAIRKQQEHITQSLRIYEGMVSAQFLAKVEVYPSEKLHALSELLNELETLNQSLRNHIQIDAHISMLHNNYLDIVNSIE